MDLLEILALCVWGVYVLRFTGRGKFVDLTPGRLLRSLRYRLSKIYPEYYGKTFECPLCKHGLEFFLPIPPYYLKHWNDSEYIHPIFRLETMNFEKYICPACGGSDRDRLYALYLEEYLTNANANLDLIEFAPTTQLKKFLSQFSNVKYTSADLNSEIADDRVDLRSMPIYRDASFDFFICSHMLEHIDDDRSAVRELFRILRPGGKGIVMVPIDLSLARTYEKPDVTTDEGRWAHFCQFDHLRLYSKSGFVSILEDAGFEVEQLGAEHFGSEVFERAGIHFRSVLYIVNRK